MRVQVITDRAAGPPVAAPVATRPPACWGTWRPELALGASSRGGLMLPDASPTAGNLYAPRGVWIDGERIIVSDSGNHRVLIWDGPPARSGVEADVVLGQPTRTSEGPAAAGRGPANGMHLPTGTLVADGRLLIADAWHHRLLVWDRVPERDDTPPDHVIGQADAESVEPNRGGDADADTLYWPFGVALVDGRFYVADTGNRRVLCWRDGVPLDGRGADLVLGQPDPGARQENRGRIGADSFRWPHAVCGTGDGGLLVADAGNHRLLRWDVHPEQDRPADAVIGQPDFVTIEESPYASQDGKLRFPYAVAGPGLALADTANNRVLIWDEAPRGAERPDLALAQLDFAGAGENRWESVAADTLCWPYGLCRHGDRLAIADSGNNRVVVWRRGKGD